MPKIHIGDLDNYDDYEDLYENTKVHKIPKKKFDDGVSTKKKQNRRGERPPWKAYPSEVAAGLR